MIRRCDYHCPSWFSTGLVCRILCPDPTCSIAILQIKKNLWFKKDFKEIPQSLSEPEQRDSNSVSNELDDVIYIVGEYGLPDGVPHAYLVSTPPSKPSCTYASLESKCVRHHRVLVEPRPVRVVPRPELADAPVSKIISILQAGGNRRSRQLHSAHQGVPGEQRRRGTGRRK
jgi:hypothetical protein